MAAAAAAAGVGARRNRGRLLPTMLTCVLLICAAALLLHGQFFAASAASSLPGDGPTSSGAARATTLQSYIVKRTILALRPGGGGLDPGVRARAEVLLKQAREQSAVVNAMAAYARKAKLDVSRQVRVLSDHARNYTQVLSRPEYRSLLQGQPSEAVVRSLDRDVKERLRISRQLVLENKELYDNQLKVQKLKDTIFTLNEQLARAKKQSQFAGLIAAKSIPKSIHCLTMRLMEERIAHPERYEAAEATEEEELEDPSLYHYAIFSDNVIAASVVVNSAVRNAREPEKHVFHVVTDKMNLGAMTVWFKMRPPNKAHIEVKAVEDYTFLNSSYVPVLKQLESANLQRFYFDNKMMDANATTGSGSSNMKFRNPKYLSMLNHLRFYLPEMYPKLGRILFLDDDVVVQKDLTPLWELDMDGKVNGAVETCFGSFHRYDKYMNFSHPLISSRFNPKACGWAYGMNFFDLDAWRREKCTEEYHYWQTLNENRSLWKLGTLPPGLITFYKTTKPLDKSWHVLGLGYNPSISMDKIHAAAVIHFNGNMKPWLDLAMTQYRHFWTKYVDYDMDLVQMCNFGH